LHFLIPSCTPQARFCDGNHYFEQSLSLAALRPSACLELFNSLESARYRAPTMKTLSLETAERQRHINAQD